MMPITTMSNQEEKACPIAVKAIRFPPFSLGTARLLHNWNRIFYQRGVIKKNIIPRKSEFKFNYQKG